MAIVQLPLVVETGNDIRITKNTIKTFEMVFNTDISSGLVSMVVRRSPTATDSLLTKVSTVVDASIGKVTFDFAPEDTVNVPSGFYIYSVIIENATGDSELATGKFTLDPYDQQLVGRLEQILNLGITGSTERVTLEIRDQNGILSNPADIQLQVLDFHDDVVVNITSFDDPLLTNPEGGIFYYDLVTASAGDYLAIWSTRFAGEEPIKTIKNIRFVTPAMYRLMPELRSYIDKARKPMDKTSGYTSADMAIYIENALRDFNVTPPLTHLALENIDSNYKEVILQGAIIQSLVAQGLLSIDQQFIYNDNGISLQIDHNAPIMGWFQQLLQSYTTKKKLYKMEFSRPTAYARTVVGLQLARAATVVSPSVLSRYRGFL